MTKLNQSGDLFPVFNRYSLDFDRHVVEDRVALIEIIFNAYGDSEAVVWCESLSVLIESLLCRALDSGSFSPHHIHNSACEEAHSEECRADA